MLIFRIARAFHQRPNDVLGWDFYEEFLPAAESLGEIPIVDELIKTIFEGFTKKDKFKSFKSSKNFKPLTKKEDRLKAFDDIKKEAELRNGRKQDQNNN